MWQGAENYDPFLSPLSWGLVAVGVLSLGAIPGTLLGLLVGILVNRGARYLRGQDLFELSGSPRFLAPIPSIAAVLLVAYGFIGLHLGRADPGLWQSMSNQPGPLHWLFPSSPGAGAPEPYAGAANDRAFLEHLLRVSACGAALCLPIMWLQLGRTFAYGWEANGIAFNSLIPARAIRVGLLVPIRLLLLGVVLFFGLVLSEAFISPNLQHGGSVGPFFVLENSNRPDYWRWNLVTAIAVIPVLCATMANGLIALLVWRTWFGPQSTNL